MTAIFSQKDLPEKGEAATVYPPRAETRSGRISPGTPSCAESSSVTASTRVDTAPSCSVMQSPRHEGKRSCPDAARSAAPLLLSRDAAAATGSPATKVSLPQPENGQLIGYRVIRGVSGLGLEKTPPATTVAPADASAAFIKTSGCAAVTKSFADDRQDLPVPQQTVVPLRTSPPSQKGLLPAAVRLAPTAAAAYPSPRKTLSGAKPPPVTGPPSAAVTPVDKRQRRQKCSEAATLAPIARSGGQHQTASTAKTKQRSFSASPAYPGRHLVTNSHSPITCMGEDRTDGLVTVADTSGPAVLKRRGFTSSTNAVHMCEGRSTGAGRSPDISLGLKSTSSISHPTARAASLKAERARVAHACTIRRFAEVGTEEDLTSGKGQVHLTTRCATEPSVRHVNQTHLKTTSSHSSNCSHGGHGSRDVQVVKLQMRKTPEQRPEALYYCCGEWMSRRARSSNDSRYNCNQLYSEKALLVLLDALGGRSGLRNGLKRMEAAAQNHRNRARLLQAEQESLKKKLAAAQRKAQISEEARRRHAQRVLNGILIAENDLMTLAANKIIVETQRAAERASRNSAAEALTAWKKERVRERKEAYAKERCHLLYERQQEYVRNAGRRRCIQERQLEAKKHVERAAQIRKENTLKERQSRRCLAVERLAASLDELRKARELERQQRERYTAFVEAYKHHPLV